MKFVYACPFCKEKIFISKCLNNCNEIFVTVVWMQYKISDYYVIVCTGRFGIMDRSRKNELASIDSSDYPKTLKEIETWIKLSSF